MFCFYVLHNFIGIGVLKAHFLLLMFCIKVINLIYSSRCLRTKQEIVLLAGFPCGFSNKQNNSCFTLLLTDFWTLPSSCQTVAKLLSVFCFLLSLWSAYEHLRSAPRARRASVCPVLLSHLQNGLERSQRDVDAFMSS